MSTKGDSAAKREGNVLCSISFIFYPEAMAMRLMEQTDVKFSMLNLLNMYFWDSSIACSLGKEGDGNKKLFIPWKICR